MSDYSYFISIFLLFISYVIIATWNSRRLEKKHKKEIAGLKQKHLQESLDRDTKFREIEERWLIKNAEISNELNAIRGEKKEFPKGGLPVKLYYTEQSHQGTVAKVVEERRKIEKQIYTILRNFEFKTKVKVLSVSCIPYKEDNPNTKFVFTESVIVNTINPFQS